MLGKYFILNYYLLSSIQVNRLTDGENAVKQVYFNLHFRAADVRQLDATAEIIDSDLSVNAARDEKVPDRDDIMVQDP